MNHSANLPALLPADLLGETLSLGQLMAMLRAYRKVILIAGLVSMLLAGMMSKLVLNKSYQASATVLADYQVNAPDSSREFPSDLAASYMATQVEFIGSSRVLGKAVDQLQLTGNAALTRGYSGPPDRLRQYLIDKVLYENLSIANPKESRLIYVSYVAPSAEQAAEIANAIANAYLSETRDRVQGPAKERAEEYLKSVAGLKTKLGAAEDAIAAFRKRAGLIDLESRGDSDSRRLDDLNAALLQAEVDRRDALTRSQQLSRLASSSDTDFEYSASPSVVQIKQDLLAAERRLIEMSKVLGPQHPEYVATEAEARALRSRLTSELQGFGGGAMANARTRSGLSSGMVESLKQRISDERKQLLAMREQQDEGGRLLRELEAAQKLYNAALDNYGQIIRSAESQYSSVSLLSEATRPIRHTKPKTLLNLVLGFFGGLILAAITSLIWELTHRRIRCAEDLEQLLGEAPLVDRGYIS